MKIDPVNPNVVSFTFPLWFFAHPTMLSKGFIEVKSQEQQIGTPLFTSHANAERFKGSIPGLKAYVLGVLKEPKDLISILNMFLTKGITHVTFDQNRSEGQFYSIDLLLRALPNATPLPPAESN